MIKLSMFKKKSGQDKARLKRFLKKFDKTFIPKLDTKVKEMDKLVWQDIDCLACANCCKTMTPTFTKADMARIAKFLKISTATLFDQYLFTDKKSTDIVNQKQPCQWLDGKTNMCQIYEVRPADCKGFPHHTKKPFDDYNHVWAQNIDKCPATYKLVLGIEDYVKQHFRF